MAKASDNIFPKVQFSEEAAPATPSSGQAVVYVKTDGKLYLKDDAGTETDLTASGGGGGGGVTFLETQTVTGSPGQISFSSISGSYKTLMFTGRIRSAEAANGASVRMRVGNGTVDSGSNYRYDYVAASSTSAAEIRLIGLGDNSTSGQFGALDLKIYDYADTTYERQVVGISAYRGSAGGVGGNHMVYGAWSNTSNAIDIVTFYTTEASGNFVVGSEITMYGISSS